MAIMINELENLDIIIEEKVEFNISNKQKYLDLFQRKKIEGIITENVNFEDDLWIIRVGGVEQPVHIINDIETHILSKIFNRSDMEFKIAYKSFILLNLHKPNRIKCFNGSMKIISVDLQSAKIDRLATNSIMTFLEYVKIPECNIKIFKDVIDNIEKREYNSKTLPEFEYIFLMTDIINNIIENKKILKYRKYLLTIMWWKICSVLPLRPSEFLRTKFKCIYEKEGSYFLDVKRSKGKSGEYIRNISKVEDYYLDDTVNIDVNMYNLINEYKKILSEELEYDEERELFPFNLVEIGYQKDKINRRYNTAIITSKDLQNNIEKFYYEVVEKEYGLQPISKYIKKEEGINYIEKTLAYDLRHIAIINLVLMGTDVLETMYLAGQNDINVAYSYFSHVKEFAKSFALGHLKSVQTKKMREDISEGTNKTNVDISRKSGQDDYIRVFNTVTGKNNIGIKVKGGYCKYNNINTDKSFCHLYERNHTICKYFVCDNKEIIEEAIKTVENQLDTDIKILMDLIKDMKKVSKFNELYQTTSYRVAKAISEIRDLNERLLTEE